ncbi:DNA mismatch repair protein MutL [Piromyces finnis]|uniref:DNA mismatch repair protein PMS1 n=1 Tax=Piromyces finnis TaxID=1754191 RepID=A0A1Y1V715_9FUNG|nr:DNA mismatch repair protein MutL [Piromyces finnis]|eukprot:ORX47944.1 DNA mismatch repair protein MutL [Piromyces finnis]
MTYQGKTSKIKSLDKDTINQICSGQVILDLSTAVKEVIENSLDAKATSIEIQFNNYGLDSITIIDNGIGINPDDYESIALPHYTSKLQEFNQLEQLSTYGFRGEALSSICASSNLVIISCTKEQEPMGVKLEYDYQGNLVKKESVARKQGTTIYMKNFFELFPVRQKTFKKNIRREYAKCLSILQGYALVCTDVKIVCSNKPPKGSRDICFSTQCNKLMKDNISNIFGSKVTKLLTEIDFSFNINSGITIKGFISQPTNSCGRNSNDRQYYFINQRPCDLQKISKCINEVYRMFNMHQYPIVVVNIEVKSDEYDINVTPNKRTILIHNEEELVTQLREELIKFCEPYRNIVATSGINYQTSKINSNNLSASLRSLSQLKSSFSHAEDLEPVDKKVLLLSPKISKENNQTIDSIFKKVDKKSSDLDEDIPMIENESIMEEENNISTPQKIRKLENGIEKILSIKGKKEKESYTDYSPADSPHSIFSSKTKTKVQYRGTIHPDIDYSVHLDYVRKHNKIKIQKKLKKLMEKSSGSLENNSMTITRTNIAKEDELTSTARLAHIISKEDFKNMDVLGQFNLGFIIARLRTAETQELFIVDQHASDEKYNFESLKKTTNIQNQRLLKPRPLELTAKDEHIVMEHLDTFKANGFELKVDMEQPPTQRISLLTQPYSKNVEFGIKDLEELIPRLVDEPPNTIIKCSKLEAMYASRACRKSVMVGMALTHKKMKTILNHMSEMDQPWNCPHGRPTMRHLASIDLQS